MAKQPNPAPGGFVPFEVPVRDETVGFTPIEVPVHIPAPEPAETTAEPVEKKEH